jgi:hypothetical protein
MSGKKARQLVRRHQEIDGGNDEQDDAKQGDDKLHGWILLKQTDFTKIEPDSRTLVNGSVVYLPNFRAASRRVPLPQTGAAAALAFDDLVALLEQALALAILALLLLLDVGAFFIGHDILPAMNSRPTMLEARVPVYKN